MGAFVSYDAIMRELRCDYIRRCSIAIPLMRGRFPSFIYREPDLQCPAEECPVAATAQRGRPRTPHTCHCPTLHLSPSPRTRLQMHIRPFLRNLPEIKMLWERTRSLRAPAGQCPTFALSAPIDGPTAESRVRFHHAVGLFCLAARAPRAGHVLRAAAFL